MTRQSCLDLRMTSSVSQRRAFFSRSVAAMIAIAALTLTAQASEAPHRPADAPTRHARENLETYDYAWSAVNQNYFDGTFHGVNWDAMGLKHRADAEAATDEAALFKVLNQLCAELRSSHLRAMTPREASVFLNEQLTSVGMRVATLENRRVVQELAPDSPAARGGVQVGWIVVTRNGEPVEKNPGFVNRPKTPVTYGFLDAKDQPHSVTLVPKMVSLPKPVARELPGGGRYLRFDRFNAQSASWLNEELKWHHRTPRIVIDLRFNSGGADPDCRLMIQEFFRQAVPVGTVVDRAGTKVALSGLAPISTRYEGKVVILVGPHTASAAEVFADVLRVHHRATIAGQRTAGAILGSQNFPLPHGGLLQVPVLDYIGVDGQRLEGHGVTPDIVLPAPTLADVRAQRDPELDAVMDRWKAG